MKTLTQFPARIRFVNADGTLTPEAVRLLDALVSRVGGSLGESGDDVFASPTAADGGPAALDITGVASADGHAAPDVAGMPSPLPYLAPVDLQPAGQGGFFETTFQGGSR